MRTSGCNSHAFFTVAASIANTPSSIRKTGVLKRPTDLSRVAVSFS